MSSTVNNQDWKEVVFKKAPPKPADQVHFQGTELSRVEKETDAARHNVVGLSLGKQIQTARIANGFTKQSDLAKAINVRPEVIMSYESGKAIPDPNIMQKLRRVLKTKFVVRK